jgi:hypothetical protein
MYIGNRDILGVLAKRKELKNIEPVFIMVFWGGGTIIMTTVLYYT